MEAVFISNDGRSIKVSSISDIKECMGEVIKSFEKVEISQNMVLVYRNGQYICIGKIVGEINQ